MNGELLKLLRLPLEKYTDINTLLKLRHYPAVCQHFAFSSRHEMALLVLKIMAERNDTLKSGDEVGDATDLSSPSRGGRTHPFAMSCIAQCRP